MSDYPEMIDPLGVDKQGTRSRRRQDSPPLPAPNASRRGVGCLSVLVVAEHVCLGLVFVGRKWSLLLCSGGSGANPCPSVMLVVVRPGAGPWWWAALALIVGCLVMVTSSRTRHRWPLWLAAIILPIAWFVFANAVFVRSVP